MRVRTRRRILIAVLVALALAASAIAYLREANSLKDPFAAAAVTDAPFPSLTYGIQAFLWWDNGDSGKHLDWVRLLSFSHVKQTFAWRDLEPKPGLWDFTQSDRILREVERRGLSVIARLGQTPGWAREASQRDAGDAPAQDIARWAIYCEKVADQPIWRTRIV